MPRRVRPPSPPCTASRVPIPSPERPSGLRVPLALSQAKPHLEPTPGALISPNSGEYCRAPPRKTSPVLPRAAARASPQSRAVRSQICGSDLINPKSTNPRKRSARPLLHKSPQILPELTRRPVACKSNCTWVLVFMSRPLPFLKI